MGRVDLFHGAKFDTSPNFEGSLNFDISAEYRYFGVISLTVMISISPTDLERE
jgi:hypothetical protein